MALSMANTQMNPARLTFGGRATLATRPAKSQRSNACTASKGHYEALVKFTGAVTAAQIALLPIAGSSLAAQPRFGIANEQNFQQQSRETFNKTDVDLTQNPDVAGKYTHSSPNLRGGPSTNIVNQAFSLADVNSFDDKLGKAKNAAGDAKGAVKSGGSQNEQGGSRQLSRILDYCRENNLSVSGCVERAFEHSDEVGKGKSGGAAYERNVTSPGK